VFFAAGTQIYSARHLSLATADTGAEVDPVALLREGTLSDADSFRAFMTLAKLEKPLADNLYSFAASRTERLPHQFKAVLKLLASPHGRLLIADEVGLGKTIEAGIILTELNARGSLDHVLVACRLPSPRSGAGRCVTGSCSSSTCLMGPAFASSCWPTSRVPVQSRVALSPR
jgi:hypothetical protein